jgi:hypothetical protein
MALCRGGLHPPCNTSLAGRLGNSKNIFTWMYRMDRIKKKTEKKSLLVYPRDYFM